MIPVILSGGSGTRLWPVSRSHYPKQFCELFEDSLQNMTLKRLSQFGQPIIVTSKLLRDFTQKKAVEAGFKNVEVIFEPEGRNTAPAIATICRILQLRGQEKDIIGIFPADHLIQNDQVFASAIELAEDCAKKDRIVTLGLKPLSPETGYGYIQINRKTVQHNKQLSSHEVLRFHEKPTLESAKHFLSEGSFFWNAGIFVFRVSLMIKMFEKYQPQIWQNLLELKPDLKNLNQIYKNLASISIDYAVMEKLTGEELLCVPCNPQWSDVGSWDAVAEVYQNTGRTRGNLIEVDSKNNFVLPTEGKRYAFVGADDLILVDTEDALLVIKKGKSQEVKTVVDRLKKEKSKLVDEHRFEERPWGRFDLLEDRNHFKSKLIRVNPEAQISYQSHSQREEHWIVVKGSGVVIIDGKETPVKAGSYVKIPLQAKHRIRNTGKEAMEFIEVQLGSYFGEDDIRRYEDDYDRVEN